MNCPNCGTQVNPGDNVCRHCGRPLYNSAPAAPAYNPVQQSSYSYEYRPIGPWGYIGYALLFGIPIVGIIMVIVFALDSTYINRRNYARSILLSMLIGFVITLITAIIIAVLGVSFGDLLYEFY